MPLANTYGISELPNARIGQRLAALGHTISCPNCRQYGSPSFYGISSWYRVAMYAGKGWRRWGTLFRAPTAASTVAHRSTVIHRGYTAPSSWGCNVCTPISSGACWRLVRCRYLLMDFGKVFRSLLLPAAPSATPLGFVGFIVA